MRTKVRKREASTSRRRGRGGKATSTPTSTTPPPGKRCVPNRGPPSPGGPSRDSPSAAQRHRSPPPNKAETTINETTAMTASVSLAFQGFSDKYNFDKTKKHSSFYKNGQKKGSFKEWGHDDSYFFDNDAGDETGKFEKSGSREKHSGHSGKSAHQHADAAGDEWGGKKGFQNHYSDTERFADKDRHHSSDGYGYGSQDGHAEYYKHTPGFYSWG
ncbi:uncharacterized protein LOC117647502 [Thrips palmi]|uniref:Uncharacterized protein LOC117647502 n=1 Tax=Thrips palmi TaxID=161013 RepID=A0A6P8Z4Y1_THRPL|nr:uncharacterized protein LOC117647502 [Thrips palmi]